MKLFGINLTPLAIANLISSSRSILLSVGAAVAYFGISDKDTIATVTGVLLNILTFASILYSNQRVEDQKGAALQTGGLIQAEHTGTELTAKLADPVKVTAELNLNQLPPKAVTQ